MEGTARHSIWSRMRQVLKEIDGKDESPAERAASLRALWKRRAADFARGPAQVGGSLPTDKLLLVKVGAGRYAFRVNDVEEVMRPLPVTPVPSVPTHFLGVVNRRGTILPIVDLRLFFGGLRTVESQENRIVVVSRNRRTIGVLVEACDTIFNAAPDMVKGAPEGKGGRAEVFLAGVITLDRKMVALIDSWRLLQDDQMKVDVAS